MFILLLIKKCHCIISLSLIIYVFTRTKDLLLKRVLNTLFSYICVYTGLC